MNVTDVQNVSNYQTIPRIFLIDVPPRNTRRNPRKEFPKDIPVIVLVELKYFVKIA